MKGIGQIIEGLEHCEGEECRSEGCPYAGAGVDGEMCFNVLWRDARVTLEMARDYIAAVMHGRIMDRLTDKLCAKLTADMLRDQLDAVRASDAEYYEDEDDSF